MNLTEVQAKARERIKHHQCPFCGANDLQVQYGSFEINDGDMATQGAWCMACDGEWTEVFTLTSASLEIGEGNEIEVDLTEEGANKPCSSSNR